MVEEGKGQDKKEKKECNIVALKCSMFIVNLIVMVAGLAVVHFGVLWYFKVSLIVDFIEKTSDNLSLIVTGIGVLVALVSFFGSFGAVLENAGMLIFFKFLLIVLFIGKIGCIVLLFVKKDLLESFSLEEEEEEMEEEEEGVKSNENYQWVVTGLLGAVSVLEMIVIVISIVLTHHINTCPKHKDKGKEGKDGKGDEGKGNDGKGDDDEGDEGDEDEGDDEGEE